MFSLNEKVVYPGHGVAKVKRFIKKKVGGAMISFFELEFINKNMTILVPANNIDSVGLRLLNSEKKIDIILATLAKPIDFDEIPNWSIRSREYEGKVRSGNLSEICRIYRDFIWLSNRKDLSFGEKNLMYQSESLLAEEVAEVSNIEKDSAVEQIRSLTLSAYKSSIQEL